MKSNSNRISTFKRAEKFARNKGVFHNRDFEKAGFFRMYLRQLAQAGVVRKITRGLYQANDFEADENLTLLEAALIAPRGIVCLASALLFHRIGTQWPGHVWLAVPRGSRIPTVKHPNMRFCEFSKKAYACGMERHKVAGGTVRVYSPAKTIADCFKYRNKYGLDMAVEALREGWNDKKFTLDELARAAESCRVRKVMQPYIEMLP